MLLSNDNFVFAINTRNNKKSNFPASHSHCTPRRRKGRGKNKMAEMVASVLGTVSTVLLISLAWKVFNWIWLKPKKIEKLLREQGIQGSSYKLLLGDTKELMRLSREAKSKPMQLSHQIVPRVMPFLQQTVEKYGEISCTWFGTFPRVIITDPDMIRDILSDKSGQIKKTRTTPVAGLLITGLLTYEGEKWAKHRRIVNPAFHVEKLKMMLPAFHSSCNEMVTKWYKLVSEGSCELDVWPDLQNLTADVISRTAFGSSFEEGRQIFQLQTEQAELLLQSLQTANIPGFRFLPTKRNKRMKEIHRVVRILLRDIIRKREKAMETGTAPNNDLLGMLMESNSMELKDNRNSKNAGISIDEVIEECKLFYFAGQETTSTLLVWTMVVLSMHPDWQERAREEVLQVFGRNPPDFDGLNHLKIVTMILNEVLRLYSPATSMMRATYKTVKLGEIVLPPGVQILIPILLVHHDRKIWGEDAGEFKPERFSEGVSKATKNQVSFFPFGWGPRICVGQTFALIEAKMAIAMILQHFSFELSSSYIHAPHSILTLQPQHGAQLILHKL